MSTITAAATETSKPLYSSLFVQVLVHIGMRLLLPQLKAAIEADQMAAGITAGGFATCFGLINAACLTT